MWTFLLLACRSPLPPPPEPVAVPPATRWVESAAGIVLEVATDHYEHPDGREVTVMGSVHVAEQAFYDVSVARLKASQVVLYEGLFASAPIFSASIRAGVTPFCTPPSYGRRWRPPASARWPSAT